MTNPRIISKIPYHLWLTRLNSQHSRKKNLINSKFATHRSIKIILKKLQNPTINKNMKEAYRMLKIRTIILHLPRKYKLTVSLNPKFNNKFSQLMKITNKKYIFILKNITQKSRQNPLKIIQRYKINLQMIKLLI